MTEPEMPEEKCIAACKRFYGGEIKHHEHCPFYPESLSKMSDEKDREIERLLCAVADLAEAIELPDNGEPVDILIKHNDAINRAYGYVNTINDDGKLSDYLSGVKGESDV